MSETKSDLWFLREAYLEALRESTDPSTQNGAVIIKNTIEGVVYCGYGANHFPKGVNEVPERWERPAKYAYVEHLV